MQKMWVWSLGREGSLEKEMATHSSILTWEIPWTEEPGGLESMGLDTTQLRNHNYMVNPNFHAFVEQTYGKG